MSAKTARLWLIIIMTFFVVSNYIFLRRVDFLHDKDETFHALACLNMLQGASNGIKPTGYLYDINWPRGFHLAALLVRFIFGPEFIFLTPTFFLIVLLFSVYKIGEFLKDRQTGLISALILGFYPGIYVSSRHFDYELAQAAMTALILSLLLKTDRFKSLRYSLLFALVLAFGLITKQSIVFFIAGPFLVTFYYLFKSAQQNKVILRNLLISMPLCLYLAYWGYYRVYFISSKSNIVRATIERLFLYNIRGLPMNWHERFHELTYYLFVIRDFYIGIIGIGLFMICLLDFILNTKDKKIRLFFASWFIVPFCILSVATSKIPHFSIAYLPVFAVISAVGASYIRPRAEAKWLIGVFLSVQLLSFTCYTFDMFPGAKGFLRSAKMYIDWGGWGMPKSMDSNPVHAASEYIIKTAGKKNVCVGTVYYTNDDTGDRWLNSSLKALIELRNNKNTVTDLVVDGSREAVDRCDFFIFIRSLSRAERWLDYESFVEDVLDSNKRHSLLAAYPEYVFDQPPKSVEGKAYINLSSENIKYLESYFPRVQFIKATKGKADIKGKEMLCLIYRKR